MHTGSVYCDYTIRGQGMNGESVRSGSVIVTKTHKGGKTKDTIFWTDVNIPRNGPEMKVSLFVFMVTFEVELLLL